jgi:1,4-dihydroxy-2-naphthoyl-CoA hydrolase
MADVSQSAAPDAEEVNPRAHRYPAVARTLGLTFTHLSRDRIAAELPASEKLANRKNILSGGVLMALADILGGTAASANRPRGAGTTTIESKTNFITAAPLGTRITGEATPLHRGRRTMVWQTRVTTAEGRLVALVTQTQLVL